MHRIRRALSVLTLAVALVATSFVGVEASSKPPAPAATVTNAAFNGLYLAGYPMSDNIFSSPGAQCMGIAYGKVANQLVLFTAHHCDRANNNTGDAVMRDPFTRIGTWGLDDEAWRNNDLAYIVLDPAFRPSIGQNHVYRGSVSGPDVWFISSQPTASDGCAGFPAGGAFPDTTYHMYRESGDDTTPYFTGSVTAFLDENWQNHSTDPDNPGTDGCVLRTNLTYGQGECCQSATPVIRYSDQTTINGFVQGRLSNVNHLYFVPLYEGLYDLNTYWTSHYPYTGARLCITDSGC